MTAATVFYFFVFILKCLCGDVLEMQVSTESATQNHRINGSTGPANVSEMVLETTASTEEWNEWPENCTLRKHANFCNCSELIGLDQEDYTMINGTAYVSALNRTYNESFYEPLDGYLYICSPTSSNRTKTGQVEGIDNVALFYITVIGLTVSLLGLLLHLITFAVVPSMKNMPGSCLASLCASMFCGYFSLLIGSVEGIRSSRGACVASAFVSHFFILSSLLWMNVKAFNIYIVLYHSTSSLRLSSTFFTWKKFCKFGGYAWGVSLAVAFIALICDNVEGVPITFQPLFARDDCWFNQLPAIWTFFIGPTFAIIGINVVFFGLSVYTIFKHRMKADDTQGMRTKSYFATYYKLALIVGILWLSGILARATDNIVFWYIFALSNALQGFFIFLAFTLTDLKKYVSQKLKPTARDPPKELSNPATTNVSCEASASSSEQASDEC